MGPMGSMDLSQPSNLQMTQSLTHQPLVSASQSASQSMPVPVPVTSMLSETNNIPVTSWLSLSQNPIIPVESRQHPVQDESTSGSFHVDINDIITGENVAEKSPESRLKEASAWLAEDLNKQSTLVNEAMQKLSQKDRLNMIRKQVGLSFDLGGPVKKKRKVQAQREEKEVNSRLLSQVWGLEEYLRTSIRSMGLPLVAVDPWVSVPIGPTETVAEKLEIDLQSLKAGDTVTPKDTGAERDLTLLLCDKDSVRLNPSLQANTTKLWDQFLELQKGLLAQVAEVKLITLLRCKRQQGATMTELDQSIYAVLVRRQRERNNGDGSHLLGDGLAQSIIQGHNQMALLWNGLLRELNIIKDF